MRNPEYQFFDTDTDTLIAQLVAMYERMVGISVHPASPEKQFILWVATVILHERVASNYNANQNVPSRASGENLDALADLFYLDKRPEAQPAACTVRFHISEPQTSPVLVPVGTRVTDGNNSLTWSTDADVYITAGDTYADIPVHCQAAGVLGNGYTPGQINTMVDLYDYCSGVENITESAGGSDAASDDEFYELLRASMDGYSCAGARGSYIYFAKAVSTEIADVAANSPAAGEVAIYVLMADGTPAGEEIKAAVLAACNQEDRRPMTDLVSVKDPDTVTYNIEFVYYIKDGATISSEEIQGRVEAAVQEYVEWQHGKLGRDINPDELRAYLGTVGKTWDAEAGEYVGTSAIKRIVLTSPDFTVLRDGKNNAEVPQVAQLGTIKITNGGFEDE